MVIKQQSDAGEIDLYDHVLEQIIYTAVKEIEGVSLIDRSHLQTISKVFSRSKYPGVSVDAKNDDESTVDLYVGINYGLNIPTVAKNIQDVVTKVVKKTTNITLKSVHVHILSIQKGAR